MHIVAEAWPNSKHVGNADILSGLEAFFYRFPSANDNHLIDVLTRTTPILIYQEAKFARGVTFRSHKVWDEIARVIYNLYNKGMRGNRLPDWN